MRVKLRERRQETSDIISFVFDLSGQIYSYIAGQWAFFELDELKFLDPRGKRRHFTLSSSPTEHNTIQFTTKLRGSGFKETLLNAPLGMQVKLEDPKGRFVLPADTHQPIVFLGGGIGVTPFRSMLRWATDENLPTPITLLYSAQTPDQIVFRREFEAVPQENHSIKIVTTITDTAITAKEWEGETGRLDAEKIKKYVEDIPQAVFYTCGPPSMVQSMSDLLKELSINDINIRTERFTGY